MTKEELPIRFRKAEQSDVSFIFNSWLKSFRSSRFASTLTSTIYFQEHHKVLERILSLSDIDIAYVEGDPNTIIGYICHAVSCNIFILHYAYVKHTFRGLGIFKALLEEAQHDPQYAGVYTHHTKAMEKQAPKLNMIHHPYLLNNLK